MPQYIHYFYLELCLDTNKRVDFIQIFLNFSSVPFVSVLLRHSCQRVHLAAQILSHLFLDRILLLLFRFNLLSDNWPLRATDKWSSVISDPVKRFKHSSHVRSDAWYSHVARRLRLFPSCNLHPLAFETFFATCGALDHSWSSRITW
jgi:hypothetical protein